MAILHSFEENKLEYEDEDEVEIIIGTRIDKESLDHNLYENDITSIICHNFSPNSNPPIKLKDSGSFRMKVVKPLTILTPPSPHMAYLYRNVCNDDGFDVVCCSSSVVIMWLELGRVDPVNSVNTELTQYGCNFRSVYASDVLDRLRRRLLDRVQLGMFRSVNIEYARSVTPVITRSISPDYDNQMTSKYFLEYTRIEVQHFKDTLIQHMGSVKKSIAERALHKREYDSRVNERQMQTHEGKVDMTKALDASLVVTESSGTESGKQDMQQIKEGYIY
nr:hypothetical protein [Tanacetum cinerariifolium]